jgi:hypothetical protein
MLPTGNFVFLTWVSQDRININPNHVKSRAAMSAYQTGLPSLLIHYRGSLRYRINNIDNKPVRV